MVTEKTTDGTPIITDEPSISRDRINTYLAIVVVVGLLILRHFWPQDANAIDTAQSTLLGILVVGGGGVAGVTSRLYKTVSTKRTPVIEPTKIDSLNSSPDISVGNVNVDSMTVASVDTSQNAGG